MKRALFPLFVALVCGVGPASAQSLLPSKGSLALRRAFSLAIVGQRLDGGVRLDGVTQGVAVNLSCYGDGTTTIKQAATNDLGIYTGATGCVGGTLRLDVSGTAVNIGSGMLLQFNGQQTIDGTTTADTTDFIHGTTAQTLRIWGSKTDATHGNYLRFLGGTTSSDIQTVRLNAGDPQADIRFGTSGGGITFSLDGTTGVLKMVNGLTVAGQGAALVLGGPGQRKVGATNAQTIGSYTVGSSDGSFEVSANINVTTSTTYNFTVTCAYTDESNVARTLTFGFTQLSGATFITAITNITGAGPYESPVYHIRAKAATSITIATAGGGTYTAIVYNGEGIIKQTS